MGAGKSTIGKQLAVRLQKEFYDSDAVIESRTGATIELIFEIEGESGFRMRETQIIEELSAHDNIILATGGGAVLNDSNRKFLRERGRVIYLQASADRIFKRTEKDLKRPLLMTDNRMERIEELLQQRRVYYEEIADLTINTDKSTVKQIVNTICKATGK